MLFVPVPISKLEVNKQINKQTRKKDGRIAHSSYVSYFCVCGREEERRSNGEQKVTR